MAGISSVLNIAKEALLAQQTAITVAGHNVANVDTQGYSRQTLTLTTAVSSPVGVGYLGNGVQAVSIQRQYDQFISRQIIDHSAELGYLETQGEVYPVLDALFDETDDLGISDLLDAFWDSWQELSDNPESEAARQEVLEKASLLVDKVHSINSSIADLRADLLVDLDTSIETVNSITREIAELNLQISATESEGAEQNDLRDQRDSLLSELSGYLDITYFESSTGAYTVMMADGHTLVEAGSHWDLAWNNDSLSWISIDADGSKSSKEIKQSIDVGGSIGGLDDLLSVIDPDDEASYVGQLDGFVNALIREVNQQYSQGVGVSPFAEELESATIGATALLNTTLDGSQAATAIAAGVVSVNGTSLGRIAGAAAQYGLASEKAANLADAVNNAACGANAYLTTQVAGSAVTSGLAAGETVHFAVGGVEVDYTASGSETASETALHVVDAINAALAAYNADSATTPKMTVEALVGDGSNGGAIDSIILRNTNAGDESAINISGVDAGDAAEAKLQLSDGSYAADAEHNAGSVTFVGSEDIVIAAGSNDLFLNQLGLGGGNKSADDRAGDGTLTFRASDHQVDGLLLGLDYGDSLQTDGGGFSLWLYNDDGSLALNYAIDVDLTRSYTLQDVADAINAAIAGCDEAQSSWLAASVRDNTLYLTPDSEHSFAFAEDSSHFLSAAELNTLFVGSSAADIAINGVVEGNVDYLAAGTVSDHGEIASGNNENSLAMATIREREDVVFSDGAQTSLEEYYRSLIGAVGMDSQSVEDRLEYTTMLVNQLTDLRDSAAGVSLDEEMANLIKFQQAYSAAAKLITMADEMIQTLLEAV